ncbi:odorant receptor 13a-like isoform X2 [Diachasmimorpha longicaudata]|uniref:odorant receptor 13a-like isoform X2 n=1 Tax=Diachasmimorpha longicaudata TaxID=58733 RepID=UPI0030B881F3
MTAHPANSWAVTLTAFFLKCCGFWPANSKFGKQVMDGLVVYTITSVVGALFFTLVDLYKCYGDMDKFTYSTMITFTGIFGTYKVISFAFKRKSFLDLVCYAKKHFWNVEYQDYGADVMKECMRRLAGIVTFAIFMCHLTVVLHYVIPLLENRGKNESDRVFPFRLYSDLPITLSPWYEILYVGQIITTWPCCYCYFCFDNFLCQLNITAVGQFIILQQEIRQICDNPKRLHSSYEDNVRSRFVRCVRRHQQLIDFVEDVKEIYRSVILGVVILLSFLICLEMFQLMTSTTSTKITTFHYCVYVGGSITQLYFYTMTCDNLTGASLGVSNAAYDVQWFSLEPEAVKNQLVKDLSMVIMRSQRACSLTIGGFAPVTLQTFTSRIKGEMTVTGNFPSDCTQIGRLNSPPGTRSSTLRRYSPRGPAATRTFASTISCLR